MLDVMFLVVLPVLPHVVQCGAVQCGAVRGSAGQSAAAARRQQRPDEHVAEGAPRPQQAARALRQPAQTLQSYYTKL